MSRAIAMQDADAGECLLPAMEPLDTTTIWQKASKVDVLLVAIPSIVPLAAFLNYENILHLVTWFIDVGPGDWLAVDGGQEQVARLQPTINGVVLPAISIALGTLSATTISSLRDRQIQIRACIHKESCLLDSLLSATMTIFAGRLRREEMKEALMLLSGYAQRLIDESSLSSSAAFRALERSGASDSELRSYIRLLHRSPPIRNAVNSNGQPVAFHEGGLAGYAPSDAPSDAQPSRMPHPSAARASTAPVEDVIEPRFFDGIQFNAQINTKELSLIRADRLALLQTTFPSIHWLSMALLGASIVVCFLIETDEKALQFLDLLQLRMLFTILIGSLSGILAICLDLNDPFSGSFRVTPSAQQLGVIRALVQGELACVQSAEAEENQRSS